MLFYLKLWFMKYVRKNFLRSFENYLQYVIHIYIE